MRFACALAAVTLLSGTGFASEKTDDLVASVREARDLALEHLLAARRADGGWTDATEVNASIGALYVATLHATGLIEEDGARATEARVLRRLLDHALPDGGYPKHPGAPSSPCITSLVVLASRLALGQVEAGDRPPGWFRENEKLGAALERRLHLALEAAEAYTASERASLGPTDDLEYRKVVDLVRAHLDPASHAAPTGGAEAALLMARLWGPPSYLLRKFALPCRALEAAMREGEPPTLERRALLARIRETQNTGGGWFFNAVTTMLCTLALAADGAGPRDPAIRAAYRYLEGCLADTGDGALRMNAVQMDLWSTAWALRAYLGTRGTTANDAEIRPALEFLLRWQGPDGGYAWGSFATKDPDNDSTAFVMGTLTSALPTAESGLAHRIRQTVRRALLYVLRNQGRHGGWGVWGRSTLSATPEPPSLTKQLLLDVPSADVAARIVTALAHAGLGPDHVAVRRGVEFLRHMQTSEGAWWCRWWAAYLSGTSMALRALAACGMTRDDEAFARGVSFLLDRQNTDGGWGETIVADIDARHAGRGASTVLHTGHVLSTLVGCGIPADDPRILAAVRYLLRMRDAEGRWHDDQVTFAFFSGSFYYAYPFTALVLPLDALNEWLRSVETTGG